MVTQFKIEKMELTHFFRTVSTPVLCDKGYSSASNSDYLCAHHLTDDIMHKKPKGKELSPKLESC
ncbi:MAG: hypothetical protein ACFNQF_05800, partial [Bacteroides sp.]